MPRQKPKAGKNITGRSAYAKSTVDGPSKRPSKTDDIYSKRLAAANDLAAAFPANVNKRLEYGDDSKVPPQGRIAKSADPSLLGSTLTETVASAKTGKGKPELGKDPASATLDRARADSTGQTLTTNQGVPIGDNQSSLKAGFRGPALLEDFILREKITHFDHERIPERIVHARGSGAHGYFECYKPLSKYTRASIFAGAGKRTPVFVRFSTVAGERGSADTVRDVRGFAVKFYTDEGNWDLVGNNIPVFFIQDAMKFPDLIHAAKPEPHFAMPQAATAHDTFWDFVSLMPESAHMLMWIMSDRAIPRSYRTMQGFGVHTFRLINAKGDSKFVKFHWEPKGGTHSLDWDEAVKICGADPDFHRRDLWESIEAGVFPEFELGMQIFSEAQAASFSFDVLDATKLIPEELVPVIPVGKMVLDRNPDNFFAETEQVAFCAAHIVPGLDFSNDPLLAGRIHSYLDTQISRLGGPNFHELPINSPIAPSHNNQRDGMHRQAIPRGKVAYEPNSLGGGCPFQAGAQGFASFPEPIEADKVRGKPERFAEHYAQATLFWNSQTTIEKAHIRRAFRFELTKVQTPAIRTRVVALLANVAPELAEQVAADLGLAVPTALPLASKRIKKPEIELSRALSLFARPGEGSVRGRKVALLVADGVEGNFVSNLQDALAKAGAVAILVGDHLGSVESEDGRHLQVEATFETTPAVLYDAVAVTGGRLNAQNLGKLGLAAEFIKDQYRHCKPIFGVMAGIDVIENAGVPLRLPNGDPDPGLLLFPHEGDRAAVTRFIAALAQHRHFLRASFPPSV